MGDVFSNLFSSSILRNVVEMSITDIVLAMLTALLIGVGIFFVYRKTYNGVLYSANFGVSMIAMALVSSLVILAVSFNPVLSLGMLGALSIVRFRTAVKDPLDIAYMFWAITAGIVAGAGLIMTAILGSVFIAGVFLALAHTKFGANSLSYIVVLSLVDDKAEKSAMDKIKGKTKKFSIKSKTVTKSGIELTVEVSLLDATATVVSELSALDGVESAALVSYNGDFGM
jgi:uncharacterized membrane protein YhiD involved in acid resistance